MKKNLTKFLTLLAAFLLLGSGSANAFYWGITGIFNGWNQGSNLINNSNNSSTVTIEIPELNNQFKFIRSSNGSSADLWYGWDKTKDALSLPITLSDNLNNAGIKIYDYDKDNLYLADKKIYNAKITFNLSDDKESLKSVVISGCTVPSLYLIGHINGFNFAPNQGLKEDGEEDIFTWKNVTINKSSGDYGYFNIATKLGDDWDRDVNSSDRYGSEITDDNNGDIILDPGDNLLIHLYKGGGEAKGTQSWQMLAGTYDIKADFTKMRISASKKVNPSWTGTGVSGKDGSYTFTGTHDTNNSVVLASDDNAINHQHVELVSVECSRHSTKQVRAAASSVDGCYTYENGILTFNHAGTYNVTSQVADNVTGYHSDPISLVATIAPKAVTAAATDVVNDGVPFGTTGVTTLTDLFTFSENLDNTDFTVSVAPADGYENWPSAANADMTFEEALNAVKGATLLQQYNGLKASTVDGFFTLKDDVTVNAVTGGDVTPGGLYPYTVDLNIPCSGVYIVTVEVTNPNYTPSTTAYEVAVYPNLRGQFGSDFGFNINGYTFASGNEIIIPTNEKDNLLTSAHAYIPGTYFASSFSVSTTSATKNVKRKAGSFDYANAAYVSIFDLSALTGAPDSKQIIYATAEKNGASHEWEFTVSKGTDFGVSTSVDSIEAVEDGEAVYFNLQGVRVSNPEHGIFVKVVNGKATKVVL